LKIVNQLNALKIIRTHRGKHGGLTLATKPESINVGKLVRKLEGAQPLIDCNDPYCPILPACRLKNVLHEAHNAFFQTLDAYTLADLLQGRQKQLSRLLANVQKADIPT
jgi:Rrf2 family nitric oxide-sensitive transcriptional repressor